MPPRQHQGSGAPPGTKKPKKGHAPAHQNKFAFRHNPKSKRTDQILAMPNVHVCRRCHEKIEWRKQYRKYKPRTQPGKCNLCQQKNVMAAYHTICSKCSTKSSKALGMIQVWNSERTTWYNEQQIQKQQQQQQSEEQVEEGEGEGQTQSTKQNDKASSSPEDPTGGAVMSMSNLNSDQEDDEPNDDDDSSNSAAPKEVGESAQTDTAVKLDDYEVKKPRTYCRVCCVCVKEPALPASDDESEVTTTTIMQSQSLRERKRLERDKKAEVAAKAKKTGAAVTAQKDKKDDKTEELQKGGDSDGHSNLYEDCSNDESYDDDDDDDDPFLKAIGGIENLVTGEAYQQKLLASQQQPQPTS